MARSQWGEERKKSPLWLDIFRIVLILGVLTGGSYIALTRYYDHVALFYGWAIIVAFLGSAIFVLIFFFSFLLSSLGKKVLDLKKVPKFLLAGVIFVFGAIPLLRATNEMVHVSVLLLVNECQLPPLYYELTTRQAPSGCLYDIWGIRKEKMKPSSNDDWYD